MNTIQRLNQQINSRFNENQRLKKAHMAAIDAYNAQAMHMQGALHRVDTSQLADDDGVSCGGCCDHQCDEGRTCPNQEPIPARVLARYAGFALCLAGIAMLLGAAIATWGHA